VTSVSNEYIVKETENNIDVSENVTPELKLLNLIFKFYKNSSWVPPQIQLNFGLSSKNNNSLKKWIDRYHGQKIKIKTEFSN
jgi:hypothetical protein